MHLNRYALLPLALAGSLSALAQQSFGGHPHGIRATREGLGPAPEITLPAVDAPAQLAADAERAAQGKGMYRWGVVHHTSIGFADGVWNTLPDGGRIWRVQLHCPGALGVALVLAPFVVPEGGQVFVYDQQGDVLGAFTAASNPGHPVLGVQPMRGERITVEYVEPAAALGQGQLVIGQVTHAYREPYAGFLNDRDLGDSGPCNINTICPEGDDWRPEIRSVALVLANGGSCTGQLLNNCNYDSVPYFLTANHCLEGGDPTTWVFRFNWESPTCDPTANGPTDHTVSGSTQLVASGGSDVLFLRLNSQPPSEFDAYYAGWDTTGVAPTEGHCIHHPSGDIKKISHCLHTLDPINIDVGNGPADCWHIPQWDQGTTEPGSSGSGLWDEHHHIVGQLYGGQAACGNSVNDYFGRFAVSWPLLRQWLGTCTDTLAGFDPGYTEPVIQNDAAVTSISGVPPNVCNGGDITPTITLKNNGAAHLHQVDIGYQLIGGASGNMPWTGNLLPGQTANVQLPSIAISNGPQTLVVTTSSPNGAADGHPADDSDTLDFVANTPGEPVYLYLTPDNYGEDITWTLDNSLGTTLYMGGPYADSDTNTVTVPFCLGDGCYTFTINDAFGDGICCSEGQGHYRITSAFGDHVTSNGQYTYTETHTFCLDGVGVQEIAGQATTVRAWPNPASDHLTVEWAATRSGDLPWRVIDMTGRAVLQGDWSTRSGRTSLALHALSPGTYALLVGSEGNTTAIRFVLQR